MLRYWADFLMGLAEARPRRALTAVNPVALRFQLFHDYVKVRHARDCSTGLNAGRERSVLQCLRYWKSGTPGPRGAEEVYPTEVTVAAGARFSSSLTSATLAFTSRSH